MQHALIYTSRIILSQANNDAKLYNQINGNETAKFLFTIWKHLLDDGTRGDQFIIKLIFPALSTLIKQRVRKG